MEDQSKDCIPKVQWELISSIQAENYERVTAFKYIGSALTENGDLDAGMTHRTQPAWTNWTSVSAVLCDYW